jgi:hypothetical protein
MAVAAAAPAKELVMACCAKTGFEIKSNIKAAKLRRPAGHPFPQFLKSGFSEGKWLLLGI